MLSNSLLKPVSFRARALVGESFLVFALRHQTNTTRVYFLYVCIYYITSTIQALKTQLFSHSKLLATNRKDSDVAQNAIFAVASSW